MAAPVSATPVRLGAPAVADDAFPMLDVVGPRLARGLAKALGEPDDLVVGAVRTVPLGDWKAALPASVAISRYRADPLKGGLLLSVPTPVIAAPMDRFYGGDGATDPAAMTLGAAGRRFFGRLAHEIGATIEAAWTDVGDLTVRFDACAYTADDVEFGEPADMLVVQTFDHRHGTIEIAHPFGALRGLAKPVAAFARRPDPAWRNRLSDAVMHARLPVRTVIARPTVPLGRLMALAPGDVIPVLLPTSVPLTVGGHLLAHGSIGEANGRAAFKIATIEHGALS